MDFLQDAYNKDIAAMPAEVFNKYDNMRQRFLTRGVMLVNSHLSKIDENVIGFFERETKEKKEAASKVNRTMEVNAIAQRMADVLLLFFKKDKE